MSSVVIGALRVKTPPYLEMCVIANITDELIPGCGKEAEIRFFSNTVLKKKKKK